MNEKSQPGGRSSRSAIVREMDRTLADAIGAETFDEALNLLAEHARLMVQAHQSAISYIPEGDFRSAIHAISLSEKYEKYNSYDVMPTGEGIWTIIFQKMTSVRMTNEQLVSHPLWKNFSGMKDERGLEHPPMRGWLAVPVLRQDGGCLGVLQASDKLDGEFTEKDLETFARLSRMITPTFELEFLNQQLVRKTEELTGRSGELSQANARLAREQYLLNSLVESIPDPVFFKDRESRFIRANKAMAHVAGFEDPGQLIGKTDADIWTRELPGDTKSDEMEIMKTGRPLINKEEQPIRPGAPERWVLVTKMPLRDEAGEIVGTFGIAREITEQKEHQLELERLNSELKRSNEDLRDFAYIASHDLQEPLRAVGGFAQLLEQTYRGQLDAQADDWLQRIVSGAERMQTLIQDLLRYSRVTSQDISFAPINCNELFDEVLNMLQASVRESGAQVERSGLPTIVGDRSQLAHVFQNLLANAIKFRGEKPPQVSVSAEQTGSEWVFSVRDNGIGIDPQHGERVFEVFKRLHGQSEFPGTGIGLAVCRRVVRRHGGRIWVESRPREGSRFRFTIPRRQL